MPIVLVDGIRVRAVSLAASRYRVRTGMTATEATSRCTALHVLSWDDLVIADAVREMTAALVAASPQVSPASGAPGTWWVGASGFEALGGERELAQALQRIAGRWHAQARVALADSCVAARAATWEGAGSGERGAKGRDAGRGMRESSGEGTTGQEARSSFPRSGPPVPSPESRIPILPLPVLVPPGGCAAYLSCVPLGLIPMPGELRETLGALGIRAGGTLAALTVEDVERRWGPEGVSAWRLARGDDPRRPGLARLEQARMVSMDVSPSVETTEPLLFLVRAALNRLTSELIADGRSAAVVSITLTLDDRRGVRPASGSQRAHTVTREARLSRPLARVVPLLERCRALLDAWTLESPVCGVSVAITATAPLNGEQGELLDPAWRDPAAAEAAFARLRTELGQDAIVRPVACDAHRPERAGKWEEIDIEQPGIGMRDARTGNREPGAGMRAGGFRARDSERGRGIPDTDSSTRSVAPLPTGSRFPVPDSRSSAPRPLLHQARGAPPIVEVGQTTDRTRHHSIAPPTIPLQLMLVQPDDAASPTSLDAPGAPVPVTPVPPATSSPTASPAHAQAGSIGPRLALLHATSPPVPSLFAPLPPSAATRPVLRQLEQPEPVVVECAGDVPRTLVWRGRHLRIRRTVGPERLTGDWWSDRYARDYWRCEDADSAGALVIYRDGQQATDRWFVHGWYD